LHFVVSTVSLDTPSEGMHGQVIDDLGENDFACIHHGSSFKRYRRIADSGFRIQVGDRHKQGFYIFITISYNNLAFKQPDSSDTNGNLIDLPGIVRIIPADNGTKVENE